ncbi:MAG TPA: hypothetical protein VK447_20065, partial [Myxococcaceae bacterium]|nr:hypothetical protein [Myxococcaceae bacterium]
DLIAPPGRTQAQILKDTDPKANRLARLPGVVPAGEPPRGTPAPAAPAPRGPPAPEGTPPTPAAPASPSPGPAAAPPPEPPKQ